MVPWWWLKVKGMKLNYERVGENSLSHDRVTANQGGRKTCDSPHTISREAYSNCFASILHVIIYS